jgi:hypothetical protein
MLSPDIVRDGVVRLPDAARAAGISAATVRLAIAEGLIVPAPIKRRHGTRTLTLDDVILIITVAALAAAAGVAFMAILKTFRGVGASVRADGIVIPLPAGAPASVGIAA